MISILIYDFGFFRFSHDRLEQDKENLGVIGWHTSWIPSIALISRNWPYFVRWIREQVEIEFSVNTQRLDVLKREELQFLNV